ncbi:MAG: hypothetical protein LBH51_01885 [Treponema sp.]|nr:hypothetical protein [Treponema sp.]
MALQVIFSGASLVLCAFFFIYFHLYIRRRTGRDGVLAACQEEVNRLVAEIDRATDRDAQLVEERIAALRKILEDADRRIALLSRDLDRRRPGTELYTALASRRPGSASPPPAEPPAAPSDTAPPRNEPPPVRPLTERVQELSRQGLAAPLIAARLGVSISEVELALAVSRRRGA